MKAHASGCGEAGIPPGSPTAAEFVSLCGIKISETLSYLFISLSNRSGLERFADILSPPREEPIFELCVVYYHNLACRGLDYDHSCAKHEVTSCPAAVWYRRRRVLGQRLRHSGLWHSDCQRLSWRATRSWRRWLWARSGRERHNVLYVRQEGSLSWR